MLREGNLSSLRDGAPDFFAAYSFDFEREFVIMTFKMTLRIFHLIDLYFEQHVYTAQAQAFLLVNKLTNNFWSSTA